MSARYCDFPLCNTQQGYCPGCSCGRRHYLGTRRRGNAHRQGHDGLAGKRGPMKSNRPQCSWWLRSVTNDDGRQLITLRRSPSLNRNQPRAFQRKTCMKLHVQFPREEVPVALRVVSRSGCVAAVFGPVGCSLPDLPTATSGASSAPRPPRQQGSGGGAV